MTEDESRYRTELGKRIALARGQKTQQVFAKELEIGKGSLLRYEKGHGVPDIETIRKICELSGVALEWLVNGKECKAGGEDGQPCPLQEKTCRINHLEDPFITDIKLWLNEMTSDDPGWRVWFKMELLSKIPKFKEWWEKKRGGDAPKQSNAA